METSHVNLGQGTVFLSFSLYWRQSFVADSRSDSLYRYWAIKIYSETYSDLHSISKMEAKRIRIEERKRLFINSTFLTPNLLLENENRFDAHDTFHHRSIKAWNSSKNVFNFWNFNFNSLPYHNIRFEFERVSFRIFCHRWKKRSLP